MKWHDKLERKYNKFAIRGLITYIVVLNLAVYILMYMDTSGALIRNLILYPNLVLKGEVWRLISFIFIPPSASLIFIIFVLYFYYLIGSSLENEWGAFKFNLYYFTGILGTIIAAFITGRGETAEYLNLSLFLAFASLFPEYEILLFFVLPVKVKYLGWLNWAIIGFTVLFIPDIPTKAAALVSVINYFIFFYNDIMRSIKIKRAVYYNRKRFKKEINRRNW